MKKYIYLKKVSNFIHKLFGMDKRKPVDSEIFYEIDELDDTDDYFWSWEEYR